MSSSPFGPMSELSLVEERATDTGDMVFTSEQLAGFDSQYLRRLAAQADSDVINGKSTGLEIQAYFGCQKTLQEFE